MRMETDEGETLVLDSIHFDGQVELPQALTLSGALAIKLNGVQRNFATEDEYCAFFEELGATPDTHYLSRPD